MKVLFSTLRVGAALVFERLLSLLIWNGCVGEMYIVNIFKESDYNLQISYSNDLISGALTEFINL